jgi:PEGA domain
MGRRTIISDMRYFIFVYLCAALTSPAQTPASAQPPGQTRPKSQTILPEGTPVRMRINRTVSSANAQVGDNVDFETLDDVKVGEIVVIPKGSTAMATITAAQPKRRMARGGKLDMNIDYVRLPSGEKLPLRGVQDVKGGGHTGAMTGGMVATAIVFFPAAPFFLFMHGKDISIPKGHEVTVYTNTDYDVTKATVPTANAPAASSASSMASAPTVADASQISIKSTPDGADITVDGRYVGSTPSVIRLAAGDHEMEIAKPGFKAWKRKMNLTTGGQVTVDATLEKEPPQ